MGRGDELHAPFGNSSGCLCLQFTPYLIDDDNFGIVVLHRLNHPNIAAIYSLESVEAGAEGAHPPLEIPGRGTFAIYIQGGVHHGLWQL